jgi:hypothetical protein
MGQAAIISVFLGQKNRQCSVTIQFNVDVSALSRLQRGFESPWGHQFRAQLSSRPQVVPERPIGRLRLGRLNEGHMRIEDEYGKLYRRHV